MHLFMEVYLRFLADNLAAHAVGGYKQKYFIYSKDM